MKKEIKTQLLKQIDLAVSFICSLLSLFIISTVYLCGLILIGFVLRSEPFITILTIGSFLLIVFATFLYPYIKNLIEIMK